MVYLDNSATTKPYSEATEKMVEILSYCYGNPSSLHSFGLKAEREVKSAREAIAKTLKCDAGEIYFTSGGTEANNMAIFGTAYALKKRGNHIITTAVEHPAVLNPFKALEKEGFRVDYIPVLEDGSINLDYAMEKICEKTILASIMLVNNELGNIFAVNEIAKIMKIKKAVGYLHSDCVQAYGKVDFNTRTLGADLISISGHKIHAPKGVGALYVKKGVRIVPHTLGGGQEKAMRSGTENTAGIAAFGVAAAKTFEDFGERTQKIASLKAYTQKRVEEEIKCARVNSFANGAPHILNISLIGQKSEDGGNLCFRRLCVQCKKPQGKQCAF